MRTMYASMNPDTGVITLSAYSVEDPRWENNHLEFAEYGRRVVNKHESARNIVSNVLYQADIRLIWED